MRRTTTATASLAVIALLLSAAACSSDPPPTAKSSARPPATSASPSASPSPASSWHFTVSGGTPVPPNGSEDTSAEAASACDRAQFARDKQTGTQVMAGFLASGRPASAALLRHFLTGTGTPVHFGPGSPVAKLARESTPFRELNGQVAAAVAEQLRAGASRVRLGSAQLPPLTFTGAGDLYWGFRNTQGLTVTGTGTRNGTRYTGTLTYVIGDSYGFPAADTLGGYGAPMRYLQTSCGAPAHPGGAHWFPDSITVTVPFSASALLAPRQLPLTRTGDWSD